MIATGMPTRKTINAPANCSSAVRSVHEQNPGRHFLSRSYRRSGRASFGWNRRGRTCWRVPLSGLLRRLGSARNFLGAKPSEGATLTRRRACVSHHCCGCRLLDTACVLQELLLEVGDVVQRHLGVLLARDRLGVLLLLLGQQLEEFRVCARSPSASRGFQPRCGSTAGKSDRTARCRLTSSAL